MPLSLRLPPQLVDIEAKNPFLHDQVWTQACFMADLAHVAEAANRSTWGRRRVG